MKSIKPALTIELLKNAAKDFCDMESSYSNKDLYGITDGKAVGTYIEHKFQEYLKNRFTYERGSSAKGIDLPGKDIETDIKVTSKKQPQSSCPFRSARQKVFGLGYNLLVFVYAKSDNPQLGAATLDFVSCTFLDKERTADYTTTYRLREMLNDGANKEDIVGYIADRNIPADEITIEQLACDIMDNAPKQGYLTISNALQWRLQYGRIVTLTDTVDGIIKLVDKITK
jgi:hypothetical protein